MKKISDVNLGMHILEVEITSRCNLNCLHCYNRQKKEIDLPLSKIKKIYNFAEKNNVETLVISGGEAMMHPDFNKFCSFIKERGHKFKLVLQTNGSFNNDDFIEKARLFDLVHISFDPINFVRKNSYKNLFLAQKLLKDKIKCYLFCTLHNKNYNLLNKIVKIANKNKVPIGFNVCLSVDKRGERLSISKKEFFKIEKKLFDFSKNDKILRYSSPTTAIFDENKKGKFKGNLGGCTAGIASCVVSFNGQVFPCPFLRISDSNIFNESLKEIWLKSKLFFKIRNRQSYKDPCGSCGFLSYCGGCRNRAFKKLGEITGNDPLCHIN